MHVCPTKMNYLFGVKTRTAFILRLGLAKTDESCLPQIIDESHTL